jgi:hypothetical protein
VETPYQYHGIKKKNYYEFGCLAVNEIKIKFNEKKEKSYIYQKLYIDI